MSTYLTTDELSMRIKYDTRYIREQMKDKVFKRDVHYIQPFGGRKILFIWEAVEKMLCGGRTEENPINLIALRRR